MKLRKTAGSRSIWRRPLSTLLVPATLAVAVIAAGCGGDGSAATEGGERSAQSGQEEIRKYGAEASGQQARQVEAALQTFLEARARGEWEEACSHLAKSVRRFLGRLTAKSERLPGESCADFVETGGKKLSASERAGLTKADVVSVRVEGSSGYVLYEDASDVEYAMAIRSEGGSWKVAGVNGTPLE